MEGLSTIHPARWLPVSKRDGIRKLSHIVSLNPANVNIPDTGSGVTALEQLVTESALTTLNTLGDNMRESLNQGFSANSLPFIVSPRSNWTTTNP
jgi:hypothetical protein